MTPLVGRSRLDFISDLAIIYCGSIDGLRFKTVALWNVNLSPAQMREEFYVFGDCRFSSLPLRPCGYPQRK